MVVDVSKDRAQSPAPDPELVNETVQHLRRDNGKFCGRRISHPIGRQQDDKSRNPHTTANRALVSDVVWLYYQDTLASVRDSIEQLRQSRLDHGKGGTDLSGQKVDLLEIGLALKRLKAEHADVWLYLDLYMKNNRNVSKVSRTMGCHDGKAARRVDDALDYLIDYVWD
jgi:hypothetical protein